MLDSITVVLVRICNCLYVRIYVGTATYVHRWLTSIFKGQQLKTADQLYTQVDKEKKKKGGATSCMTEKSQRKRMLLKSQGSVC